MLSGYGLFFIDQISHQEQEHQTATAQEEHKIGSFAICG
jgi:hypothetical protein